MKKIMICLLAVLVLAACNNKQENQENSTVAEQSEMPAPEADGQDDGWMKQTTIMSSKPMVVDFYATWCGPCKELAPILDEIEKNHKGEVIFKRIDVDQEPELAQEFRIEAIPMLMFITPTGEYQTIVGLQDAPVIEEKITELLARSTKNL
jgi:thioredoxin